MECLSATIPVPQNPSVLKLASQHSFVNQEEAVRYELKGLASMMSFKSGRQDLPLLSVEKGREEL